jgi:hypothetical protein
MKSAAIFARYCPRKRTRFLEPISSSPSMMNFTLSGSVLAALRYEPTAATWAMTPPLSSAVPRP